MRLGLGLRRLYDNPLIVKDGLSRVRSWRAPWVIALYLGSLGLLGGLVFAYKLGSLQATGGYASLGGAVFGALALTQLALVCLFAPAVTAGAVSGERERQTLDVLVISRLTPFWIVWGKLVASVAFMLLLLMAALPLFATVFLFGGIDLGQFAIAQLLTVTTMLAAAAVTLFLSTLFARTLAATVAAYGITFAATAGSWVVGMILSQLALAQGVGPRPMNPLLMYNPIQAMAATLQVGAGTLYPMNNAYGSAAIGRAVIVGGGGGTLVSPVLPSPTLLPSTAWLGTTLIELMVVTLAITASVLILYRRRA